MSPAGASSGGRPRLYSYPKCSTCRRALKWLAAEGLEVDLVDITLSPPSKVQLEHIWASLADPRRLFNTSGASYRALGAAQVKAMSRDEAITALAADGKLIRRPLLLAEGVAVLTGFDPEIWKEALKPLLRSAGPELRSTVAP
ncbi:Spx/MgsR family RNA polymerase-binding regulatory protein [Synechococcus sp. EJ6-Ellesmere]|uniref:Spx/MgsR family RNA polymerase-binding regulatory protein n=1 Tax=Synechococcus sp. EJ6-Ellesmere TaxID=2823734 RepID=UPI0020CBFBB5|nr:Spx/MgsR family RNA polymerase-binding regulatory protein [Synechococcus sp. EJ6-Ellesmere]MCP9826724.1 Spx/MgsR family RNA polymerase-binding regulatory protein [Synechococcus sp. EJ6-Ellesmere]